MNAFNEITSSKFSTRGSHDKWYAGWSRPGLKDLKLQLKVDDSFGKLIEFELCKKLGKARLARDRAESGSTNSSEGGGGQGRRRFQQSHVECEHILLTQ